MALSLSAMILMPFFRYWSKFRSLIQCQSNAHPQVHAGPASQFAGIAYDSCQASCIAGGEQATTCVFLSTAAYISKTLSTLCFEQVVLDLGRRPEARFAGATGGEYLREEEASFLTDDHCNQHCPASVHAQNVCHHSLAATNVQTCAA